MVGGPEIVSSDPENLRANWASVGWRYWFGFTYGTRHVLSQDSAWALTCRNSRRILKRGTKWCNFLKYLPEWVLVSRRIIRGETLKETRKEHRKETGN